MLAMRHETTTELEAFAQIYERDVELISVRRPAAAAQAVAGQLLAERLDLQVDWIQAPEQADGVAAALADGFSGAPPAALVDEIELAVELLTELLDCRAVGVRLTTLRQPMCPRFHQDQVPCRLLITFAGPATEWIAAGQVDLPRLRDRTCTADPVLAGGRVQQLETGAWSLLKGGAWRDGYAGVVHRSPAASGSAGRLLASFDPIFQ
ncbi:MAG: DUF1826 domain-containing protein [Pseudomonadota bacterium]